MVSEKVLVHHFNSLQVSVFRISSLEISNRQAQLVLGGGRRCVPGHVAVQLLEQNRSERCLAKRRKADPRRAVRPSAEGN